MRILIAEDDKVSLRLLEAMLAGRQYEVITCTNGAEACRILQEKDAPQLAILDWEMPELDGPQVCREVRRRGTEPYTYIVLLTTRSEKADIIAGMDAGADDYLVKPFDIHELEVRLRAGRRILELQDQLIAAREALRVQATRDPLTGILNRGAIVQALTAEVLRARRERRSVGVAMLDLDYFKQVNDTHGHAAGDDVLREVTRRMRSSVRPYDELGRYGGEEFLIVAPGCDLRGVIVMAERVRAAVAATPIDAEAGPIPVTCSLGVASNQGDGDRDQEADRLIRDADHALYRAKHLGRNLVAQTTAPDDQAPVPAHNG